MGFPRVAAIASLIPLLIGAVLFAQQKDIRFERISVEQGLSQSSVYYILQDTRGFLWFGTENGLNKYDGYKFTTYRHDIDNPTSLSDNWIQVIYEDRSGVLWIGTKRGGLNRFDREKEHFTRYKYDANNPNSLSNNDVYSIYEDKSGTLWVGTINEGLNRFDRDEEKFTRFVYEADEYLWQPNSILSIVEDSSGVLWLGTWGGLARFDRETGEFSYYRHDPNDPSSLSDNNIVKIHQDPSGVLWVCTQNGGLNRFDREDERFTQFLHDSDDPNSLSSNYAYSICRDKSGVLWVTTIEGGLNSFNRDTEQFTRYQHDPYNPRSLSHNSVLSIYEDRSGVLWIGTFFGGICKFDRQKEHFTHYQHDPGDPQSLSQNEVTSIYEDKSGSVWIGTMGGGLNRFDRKSEKFEHFRADTDDITSLTHDIVWSIHRSYRGGRDDLWVGTFNGLNKLNRSTGQFTQYTHDPENPTSLRDNIIRAVYEDELGMVWVGTWNGGLNLLNPETEQFKQVSSGATVSIYEDASDVLWMGTMVGLKRFDRGSRQFTRYRHDKDDAASLSNDVVWSINESHHGGKSVLWIGTADGLNRFDRETETFTRYTVKDGLPNNVIDGILEDGQGNIWLSTKNGLSRFNPEEETFRNYDVSDGLQGNEFIHQAYCKTPNGEMFFGGVNGFNRFHPDSIKDNPHVPPIVITDFQIFNEPVKISDDDQTRNENVYTLPKHITEVEEIELTYRERVFSFEFAALDYRNPQKNQYAYMMEGFDEDWYHTDATRRFATYTNLDPGEYVFRVKGSNNDGLWNEVGASIAIIISPPPWKSLWAYMLYALAIVATLYAAWRATLNRARTLNEMKLQRVEAEKLQEMDQLKSRFFANISHEFRTPLTLIMGPLELSIAKIRDRAMKEDLAIARRNAGRLLRLINQLLDLSKMETGSMRLEAREEDLVPLLRRFVQTFESLAESKQITLRLHTPEDQVLVYADRDKLEKIIANLLSNALKFTPPGGIVDLSLSVIHAATDTGGALPKEMPFGLVAIEVRDTGMGIEADQLDKVFDRFYQVDGTHTREQEGTGIGLALTKELVELHHGEIAVSSESGLGSRFTVRLPLGREHLRASEIAKPAAEYETVEQEATRAFAEEVGPSETIPEPEAPISSEESRSQVLIVEDNSDMRHYIRGDLEESYRIVEARNGNEGLERALERVPDLVISDVMMPGMDGFELCEKLKTDERTSHIPVILLTAKAGMEDKVEGLETGADDYITKPFDVRELHTRVKNLIEQRRRLRERFRRDAMLEPKDITVTSTDERFLQRALDAMEKHMSDDKFGVAAFCREVGMSRTNLHYKLRALTGQSTSEFIRTRRLVRAAQLLQHNFGSVTEVAYEVGFSNPSHFSKCFKKQYGQPPSQYHPAGTSKP